MKKCFCMFLACLILLGMNSFALAETELGTQLADLELQLPEAAFSNTEKAILDRGSFLSTTDKVTLSETGVEVETEDGLLLSFTYPTENVVCLTQDIMQQSLMYLLFYSDNVTSVADDFVREGMHLNIYDYETGTDIYLYTCTSGFSELLQNISVYSDDDILIVQQALADNYFADADSVSVGMVGGNLWFFADYSSGGLLLTFVNGQEVVCTFRYEDGTGPVSAITLLENLNVSAA